MKTLFALSVLTLPFFTLAQSNDQGKWKIGAQFATDIYFANNCYSTGIAPGGCYDPYPENLFPGTNRLYYTAGISSHYSLTNHLELGSGFSFSVKENSAPYYYCILENGLYQTYQTFLKTPKEYLEVPVFARYNFFNSKLRAHIEAGVATGFEVNTNASYEDRFLLSANGGIGMNYTIGAKVNVGLTTSYKRKLTDFRRYPGYTSKNCISVEIKTLYIFGK